MRSCLWISVTEPARSPKLVVDSWPAWHFMVMAVSQGRNCTCSRAAWRDTSKRGSQYRGMHPPGLVLWWADEHHPRPPASCSAIRLTGGYTYKAGSGKQLLQAPSRGEPPPQAEAFSITTPPGEVPYCSSQKQSLPRN